MLNPFVTYPQSSRVIVDRQIDNTWIASLPGVPKVAASAKYPFSAIKNLIDRVGDRSLSLASLRPVDDRMQNDHLEFEIPRTDWRPKVSAN